MLGNMKRQVSAARLIKALNQVYHCVDEAGNDRWINEKRSVLYDHVQASFLTSREIMPFTLTYIVDAWLKFRRLSPERRLSILEMCEDEIRQATDIPTR